jgi:hypothetical protein
MGSIIELLGLEVDAAAGSSAGGGDAVGSSVLSPSMGAGGGVGATGAAGGVFVFFGSLPFLPLAFASAAPTAFGFGWATATPAPRPTTRQPERTRAATCRGQLITVECIILTSARGAAFYGP